MTVQTRVRGPRKGRKEEKGQLVRKEVKAGRTLLRRKERASLAGQAVSPRIAQLRKYFNYYIINVI